MTTKAEILHSIRSYCIGCSGGSVGEVRKCHLEHCELFDFRFGKDPNPAYRGFAIKPAIQPDDPENDDEK